MQDVIDNQVTPLSLACGAEIGGVDLTRPLSAETVRAIRDAWNKHIVLVFRGQKISQDDQLRFASYFGHLGERKRAKTLLTVPLAGGTRRGDAVERGAVAGAARRAGLAAGP